MPRGTGVNIRTWALKKSVYRKWLGGEKNRGVNILVLGSPRTTRKTQEVTDTGHLGPMPDIRATPMELDSPAMHPKPPSFLTQAELLNGRRIINDYILQNINISNFA